MEVPNIEVSPREALGSRASRRLRAEGRVPINLMGLDRPPRSLTIGAEEAADLVKNSTHLVELSLEGEIQRALVTEVQFDALGDAILHLDFTRVKRGQLVTVTVPVELEGEPKGVQAGGVLNHILAELEVECTPSKIPDRILIDVSELDIAETVTVADLTLPEGVRATATDDVGIVTVSPPQSAEPAPGEAEEAEGAEPEIIGEGGESKDEDKSQEGEG